MAFNYQIRDGLIEATFHGKVTADDLDEVLTTLRDIESQMEITPDRISDLTDANFSGLHSEYVEAFAKSRHGAKLKNHVKSAIIAPKPEQYGLARVFYVYNQNPAIDIRIFKDSASAYEWIGREPKSANKPNA